MSTTPTIRLDGLDRGFPEDAEGLTATEVTARGWRLHADLDTPIAVIRAERMAGNLAVMEAWRRASHVELWPHAKTVMSPELVAAQIEAGASGVTAATVPQVRALVRWGFDRVLLANQLVQPRQARWVGERIVEGLTFGSLVDSVATVEVLQTAGAATGAVFDVLLELGVEGGRCGIRTPFEAEPIVDALALSPNVRLVGVEGYEGVSGGDRGPEAMAKVDAYLDDLFGHFELLRPHFATDRPIFSAGGSMFFDRAAEFGSRITGPHRVVVRSGCYALHDVGLFARATPLPHADDAPGLQPALFVWGSVLSRPEPGRAVLDVGRRDVGFDQGLPVPLRRWSHTRDTVAPIERTTVVGLNDQHAIVDLDPAVELEVGDRIELGISHPCTTMDKWRTVALVDEAFTVTGCISTRF